MALPVWTRQVLQFIGCRIPLALLTLVINPWDSAYLFKASLRRGLTQQSLNGNSVSQSGGAASPVLSPVHPQQPLGEAVGVQVEEKRAPGDKQRVTNWPMSLKAPEWTAIGPQSPDSAHLKG